jgi:hypothetical protein
MSRKYGFIHPLPHTPSWRNASLLKHRDKFTFIVKVFMKIRYNEIEKTTIKPNSQSYLVDTENSFLGGKAAGAGS